MRELLRRWISIFRVPATRWYLRKQRTFTCKGITVAVDPGVFHPGLFNSTKSLIDFIAAHDITGQSFLELGCGTALLSILAARSGATVTASDVSWKAVENARANVVRNRVSVTVVHSDLFDELGDSCFDWVVINPPYFARDPQNEDERAWYCGADFEYFKRLFTDLRRHLRPGGRAVMILSSGTAWGTIRQLAEKAGYRFERLRTNRFLLEANFIFRIVDNAGGL